MTELHATGRVGLGLFRPMPAEGSSATVTCFRLDMGYATGLGIRGELPACAVHIRLIFVYIFLLSLYVVSFILLVP